MIVRGIRSVRSIRSTRRRRNSTTRHFNRRKAFVAGVIAAAIGIVMIGILVPRTVRRAEVVAAAFVYTAPDQQTTAYELPGKAVEALGAAATGHDNLLMVRIEGDGRVTTATKDMTPRTERGDVLQVPQRIDQDLKNKVTEIEAEMNRPTLGTESRALYLGLLAARIPEGTPTFIFSSGIDLSAPTDLRVLAWETPADEVIQVVSEADAAPELSGSPVTFVMAAPTGGQEIRTAQTNYLHSLWGGLLTNAGAASVSFIDGMPGLSKSDQTVPIVPLPDLPGTPIPATPDPVQPQRFSCTMQTSAWFVPDKAILLDEELVRASLADCAARITPNHSVIIEGWVAYLGTLGPDGRPTDAGDVMLSQDRADALKTVLMSMGVPADVITTKGWGAVNQPHPDDPASPANRVCVITVTPDD